MTDSSSITDPMFGKTHAAIQQQIETANAGVQTFYTGTLVSFKKTINLLSLVVLFLMEYFS